MRLISASKKIELKRILEWIERSLQDDIKIAIFLTHNKLICFYQMSYYYL
jgi:hypothetical protein